MLIAESALIALRSLRGNLFRASLTMLGIIIGVAAVITMLALGAGAQRAIEEQLLALGGDILLIRPGQFRSRGVAREQSTLANADAVALARDARHLDGVVAESSAAQQVTFGNTNLNLALIGTTVDYAELHGLALAVGRMYSVAEDSGRKRVAVLGSDVPEALGTDANGIIGRTIQIKGAPFEVIGVFGRKGSQGWRTPDDDILIPLRTAQLRVNGRSSVDIIHARVAPASTVESALVDIERVLRATHGILPGRDNDFSIYDRRQFLDTQQEATRIFTWLLAGIAGVSLLVGGIGIMNIMLVTVTERTREIGIRKALGATRANVVLQFLVESMVICLIGGLVGVALGIGASALAAHLASWKTVVSLPSAVGVFLFSAAIGLVFGLLPALRAARLDPVEALRYE